ncbi:MAG: cyclase/dehydrase [Leptolyngbyaceae cyanobacterium SM1_1_3]|nr:cyclase/dehydrase [Leptolyngbyaceae cyanobacterium SM1_1_3]NJN03253.1 cyclase/dehydrase [Leptolyngbyaceae cyanobacterium RM1_1_2]NJO11213.1 cyclase/dehydrase [Leptolyngbyaceae cyanobacterium SL_1_1]
MSHLAAPDRALLEQGGIAIMGEDGQYTAMALADANWQTTWEVVRDYENFANFLPTVISSRIVEAEGNRTVVEQIDSRDVMLTTIESTLLTENIEKSQEIEFRLLDGDLEKLEGSWRLDSIADDNSGLLKTLITQQVTAQADIGLLDGAFYSIFESSLKKNLQAIAAEAERRASQG